MALTPIRFETSSDLLYWFRLLNQNPETQIFISDTSQYYYVSKDSEIPQNLTPNYDIHNLARNISEDFFALETAPDISSLEAINKARTKMDTSYLNRTFITLSLATWAQSLAVNLNFGNLINPDLLKNILKGCAEVDLVNDICRIYLEKNILLGSYLAAALKKTTDDQQRHELKAWIKELDENIKNNIEARKKRLEIIDQASNPFIKAKEKYLQHIAHDPELIALRHEIENLRQKQAHLEEKYTAKQIRTPLLKNITFFSIIIGLPLLLEIFIIVMVGVFAPPIGLTIVACLIVLLDLSITIFPNLLNRPAQFLGNFYQKVDNFFDNNLNKDAEAIAALQQEIAELSPIIAYAESKEAYDAIEVLIAEKKQINTLQLKQMEDILYHGAPEPEINTQGHAQAKASQLGIFANKNEVGKELNEPGHTSELCHSREGGNLSL